MLKIKCMGIIDTPNGKRYRICDAGGTQKVISEKQLTYILRTRQAMCINLAFENGTYVLRQNNAGNAGGGTTVKDAKSLTPVQAYKAYIAQCQRNGVTPDAEYEIKGDDVCLVKCHVINGVFVIQPFVTETSEDSPFEKCKSLKVINRSRLTDMSYIFAKTALESLDLSEFDTSRVTNMESMFEDSEHLTALDLSNFNTSNVTDMSAMFACCNALATLNISSFDTHNVEYVPNMFYACRSLTSLNVSSFDTSKMIDMSHMFDCCDKLTTLDVSNFNTSRVTDMQGLFMCCSSLVELDLRNFDTSLVEDMSDMFLECTALKRVDVSSFNTFRVKKIDSMFANCDSLETFDVHHFNLRSVEKIEYDYYPAQFREDEEDEDEEYEDSYDAWLSDNEDYLKHLYDDD